MVLYADRAAVVVAVRRRHGDWTEAEILLMAARKPFHVKIYSWRHEQLRQMTRRMCRDGKLVMVDRNKQEFVYRTPQRKDPDATP